MVQGEFTVTYLLVELLKRISANVVAVCAERIVLEKQMENRKSRKFVEFEFVRYRYYGQASMQIGRDSSRMWACGLYDLSNIGILVFGSSQGKNRVVSF